MLKADIRPWKETLTETAYPVLLLTLGYWIFRGMPLWEALLVSCGLVFFIGCIARFRTFKKLRRAEQRRQAAMKVPQWIPLAVPQPIAEPVAITLPLVISSKPDWLGALIIPPVVWIANLVMLTIFVWQFKGSYIPALLFSAVLAVPISILAYLTGFEWIEAREEGLTIRTFFRHRTILWREACLFAIDATVETTKAPDRYELSSATTILRWQRHLSRPWMTHLSSSFQEYSQQMDALLPLIAGKTGLPLYDLRDWQLPPLPAPPEPQPASLWRGE